MLTKTLQIAAICFSMANPSDFHIEQPKKATTPFNISLTYQNAYTNTIQKGTTPETYQNTFKRSATASNSYMLINTYSYAETIYVQNGNDYLIEANTNFTDRTTTKLNTFQIVPYQNTIQDTVTLTAQSRINVWGNNNYPITAITEIYTSIESYWQQFIDQSNYGTMWQQNKYTIDAITNPQMGFLYTKTITQTIIQPLTQNGTTTFTTTFDIALNPNNVNYIYAFTYLTTIQNGVNYSLNDAVGSPVTTWINGGNTQTATISGYWVEGISNYEVIDIPGIMWEVLTMPFTFISIAFNLTIFPNTPYQVNLSNLFLSILGIIIFVFILSKFIKKV